VQRKTIKTLLPFAAYSQTSAAPFTKDAERAAIFCLAELDKDRGGGFFKKRAAENLVFIAEVYYPFWVAPFGSMTLHWDGLNITSHALNYSILPDLKIFKDNLTVSSEIRQTYVTFLSHNLTYFKVSENEETKVIDGLITDADFLKEFMPYLNEAVLTEAPVIDSVLISPSNDEAAILLMTQELENLQSKFVGEVKELNELIKLLNLKTQEFLEMLREEVKKSGEKSSKPIEEAKALLEDVTAQINLEYREKVRAVSTQFEQETLAAQKEVITLEKAKEQLTAEIEQCQAEIKTAAVNKDYVTEKKWKEKRSELKKEIPGITKKTGALTEKIRAIEENKKHAIFQLKSENDSKIKDASKDLMAIEASRDAEISIFQKEMETLEELTANIIKQIDQLAKMREATIAEFDKLGIQQANVNLSLVRMPFYLIRYQSGTNRRYTFFAPSIVGSVGVGAKLRSAMGKVKIRQLFQPRSKKIISLLHKFAVLLEEDVAFGSEINEACHKANILKAENLRQSIAAGLDKLKEDGWVSEQERESFRQMMT
jgi:DNA repair exonuclease SbcCD ATPase subunit